MCPTENRSGTPCGVEPPPIPSNEANLTPWTKSNFLAVGPYKLLQSIGEGGFGEVFMAEQREPVRRRVALKVIEPPPIPSNEANLTPWTKSNFLAVI